MDTSEDSVLVALPPAELSSRLADSDWTKPLYVSTEQLLRLWRAARKAADEKRVGIMVHHLSIRILALARAFVLRTNLVDHLGGDLDRAALQLSQCVWLSLIERRANLSFAERKFGLFFKRRAIEFWRQTLNSKNQATSLDCVPSEEGDDPPEHPALRCDETPETIAVRRQHFNGTVGRLRTILTRDEFFVYTMISMQEMSVIEIAAALEVTTRTVNNYKNAAIAKVEKEFHQ